MGKNFRETLEDRFKDPEFQEEWNEQQKKAWATKRLMEEIEKGRRSGEENGYLTVEEIEAHFREKAKSL